MHRPNTNILASLGKIVVNNNTASLPVFFKRDANTEGTETFTFKILASPEYALDSNLTTTVTVYDNSINRSFLLTTTPNIASANEGESYVVNIYTTEVEDGTYMAWQIDGIQANDIVTPMSGNVEICNNYANVLITTVRDRLTEGPETIYFMLKANTDPHIELAQNLYANVTLVDTSLTPNYALIANVYTVAEGDAVEFMVQTANLESNVILNYTVNGISQVDLVYGSITGKMAHNAFNGNANGNANIVLRIAKDRVTEGTETLQFIVLADNSIKLLNNLYANVTITDNSRTPAFNVYSNVSIVGEGGSVMFTVEADNIDNNTVMAYVIEGVNSDDVVGGATRLLGDVQLLSTDGGFKALGNVYIGIREDRKTEGTENVTFVLLTNTSLFHNTNSSVSVAIQDLSKNPTITVTANRASVNENGVVQFNVITTDVSAGSLFEYTITPIADVNSHIALNTFTTTTGRLEINSAGRANVVVNMKEDYITEGIEYLTITIPPNSSANTDGTSAAVLINDTSQTPTLTLTYNINPVSEGSTVTILFTGSYIPSGTPISWSLSAGSSDMTPNSGTVIMVLDPSFPVTSNSITLTAIADSTTEGIETYTVTTGAVSAIGLASKSLSGSIADTSQAPPPPPPPAPPAVPPPPPPGAVLSSFFNCDLEITSPASESSGVVSFPGWKIYKPGVGTVASHLRLNGFSSILGWPTPMDPSPSPLAAPKPYGDQDAPISMDFDYEFVSDSRPGFGGTSALRIYSNGTSVPYGIVRGPYLVSEFAVSLTAGDIVSFHWKAANGGDDFDVFAYLLNETTGSTVLLLDERGTSSSWALVTKTITAGEAGTYKFVFINGSYDASGGQALGASLYLDNICVNDPAVIGSTPPAPPPPAVPPPPPATAPAAPAPIVINGLSGDLASQIGTFGQGYKIYDIDLGTRTGTFTINFDFLNSYDYAELDWNGTKVNTGFGKGVKSLTINKTSSSPSSVRLTINPNNVSGWEGSTGLYTNGEVNPGGWWQGSGGSVGGATIPTGGVVNPPTTPPPPYTPKGDGTVTCPTTYTNRKLKGTGSIDLNNEFDVTGSLNGDPLWGNNSQGYSDDSDISRAVVHAGLASVGELIRARLTAKDYVVPISGLTSNGITSLPLTAGWCGITLTRLTPRPTPTYTVTPQLISSDEGYIVIFTVDTTLVTDGTVFKYATSGTTSSADFQHIPYFDAYGDVRNAFINSVQSGSTWANWPGSRNAATPNAVLFANYHYANFGIAESRISPSTLNNDYFVTQRTVPVSSNRTSVTLFITADKLTEGAETVIMTIKDNTTNATLATSGTVTINDTSLTPALVIGITSDVSNAPEASTTNVNFTISATGFTSTQLGASGRWFRVRVTGTNVTSGDIQGGAVSNAVKITATSQLPFSFGWGFTEDLLTEGVETARFDVYTWLDGQPENTTASAAHCFVGITDTSLSPAPPPPPPGVPLASNPIITSFFWNITNDSSYKASQNQLAGLFWSTNPKPGDITHAEIRGYRGSTYQTSGSFRVIRAALSTFQATSNYILHEFKPGDGYELGLGDFINDSEIMSYRLILTRSNGTEYSPSFDLQWYVGSAGVETGS